MLHFTSMMPPLLELAKLEREEIEAAVETLISVLDKIDGDPDLEPNGDELDGTGSAEEDFGHFFGGKGAGCEISDPGGGNVEDEEQEQCDDEGADDCSLTRRRTRDMIRRTRCERTFYSRIAVRDGQRVLERVPDGWHLRSHSIATGFAADLVN